MKRFRFDPVIEAAIHWIQAQKNIPTGARQAAKRPTEKVSATG